MAKRKTSQSEQQGNRPSLMEPRNSAKEKILKQIDKGYEIRNTSIDTLEYLKQMKHEKKSWKSYTEELLSRLFDNEQFSSEFARSDIKLLYSMGKKDFWENVTEFQDEMDECLNNLKTLSNKLELIPELNQTQTMIVTASSQATDFTKVFIIHGHDSEAKLSAARFVEKLGLQAVIFHEQVSQGDTIIEKLERLSDVGYAIVLLTPDDKGYVKHLPQDQATSRARQNVVFEWGYFIAKLGRSKVLALLKEDVEIPSDLQGVLWERMDEGGAWQYKVAKELQAAGYKVDMNNI